MLLVIIVILNDRIYKLILFSQRELDPSSYLLSLKQSMMSKTPKDQVELMLKNLMFRKVAFLANPFILKRNFRVVYQLINLPINL